MSVTRSDIKSAVKALGVLEGDIVLVHSSMKSMGYVEDGPDAVIDGFLDVVGAEGTLVMPTLSQKNFSNAYKDWSMDRPSDVGLLTEVFRKRPEALRSNQATHSVAAIGALADELTHEHTAFGPRFGAFGDYAFSYSSPWEKMYNRGAKIVFIGVSMSCNTFKHFVEYRYIEKVLKKIEGKDGSEVLKKKLKHFDKEYISHPGIWPYLDGEKLQEVYVDAGFVTETKCGEAQLLCMPVKNCVDFTEELLEKEPDKWINNDTLDWVNEAKKLIK